MGLGPMMTCGTRNAILATHRGSGALMLTPVMVFVFIPFSMRLLGPWLRGGVTVLAHVSRRLHQRGA